jgi:hypothetical protein
MKKQAKTGRKMRFGEDDIWLLQEREKLPGLPLQSKIKKLSRCFPVFTAPEKEKNETNGRIIRPE